MSTQWVTPPRQGGAVWESFHLVGWDLNLNTGAAGGIGSVFASSVSGFEHLEFRWPSLVSWLLFSWCCLVWQEAFFRVLCRDQLTQGERFSVWTRHHRRELGLCLVLGARHLESAAQETSVQKVNIFKQFSHYIYIYLEECVWLYVCVCVHVYHDKW